MTFKLNRALQHRVIEAFGASRLAVIGEMIQFLLAGILENNVVVPLYIHVYVHIYIYIYIYIYIHIYIYTNIHASWKSKTLERTVPMDLFIVNSY